MSEKGKIDKQKARKGFRIFSSLISRHKKTLSLLISLSIFGAILGGSVPYIAGKFFDSILQKGSVDLGFIQPIPLWAFFLGLWLIIQIATKVLDYSLFYSRTRFRTILKNLYILDGMKKMLHLPLSFHKDNKMGDTVSRIEKASAMLNSSVEFVIDAGAYMLSGIAGLFFVFWINYIFGFVILFSIVIYLAIVRKILVPLQKIQSQSAKIEGEAQGDLYDAIGNIKVVKQNASEDSEFKKFYKKVISGVQALDLRAIGIEAGSYAFQDVVLLFVQVTIFVVSVFFIRAGKMTLGELFALNGYNAMIISPFNYFIRWWDMLLKWFIALERAEKIFGHKDEEYDPKDAKLQDSPSGDLEFRNATFSYEDGGEKGKKKTSVLRNVSFKVKRGETVAIVGESGVGKTTIADLMSGFYFPQKGKILVDGVPTDKIPLKVLRKNIAVVSQDITIFNESISYNIRYGNFDADRREVVGAAKEAGAHEFISKFDKKYGQLVGERGVKLSGGQRQRVAIAQAILKNAKILVLDEPTSALDARTEKLVTGSLEKLMKGRTTIIIAHRLSTVRKADKIIVLDKGRVVEIGKHKDLIKKRGGVYRKFYEVQKL